MEKNDFKKLARDVYFKPNMEFSGVSGSEAMRNAIKEALHGEYTIYSWNKYKQDVLDRKSVV